MCFVSKQAYTACRTAISSLQQVGFKSRTGGTGHYWVACFPQIHWFSIINSCVTVLLLTGFLATILMRVLKNDFLKYSRDDDSARV